MPANRATSPRFSSMRISWLYLQMRSVRQADALDPLHADRHRLGAARDPRRADRRRQGPQFRPHPRARPRAEVADRARRRRHFPPDQRVAAGAAARPGAGQGGRERRLSEVLMEGHSWPAAGGHERLLRGSETRRVSADHPAAMETPDGRVWVSAAQPGCRFMPRRFHDGHACRCAHRQMDTRHRQRHRVRPGPVRSAPAHLRAPA